MSRPDPIVIVGGSAAGLTTAEALRRAGYAGRITMIGEERHLPYDRPPLSKQVLAGTWEPERAALRDDPAYAKLDLDLRLGVAATGLDLAAQTVRLAGGDTVRYGDLVIATGVAARRLDSAAHLAGVHVLRTLDDTMALRADLAGARSVVVIGAGFLGTETAAAATQLGIPTTIVDPLPAPMVRQFGPEIGRLVADLHRRHGVTLLTGIGVAQLYGADRVHGVELTDGRKIEADVVVTAIGSVPATQWLADSGLTIDDGVHCDRFCRAAPDVYAAGDVARWHNPLFDRAMRVEHRMNATEQALAVAANLLGTPTPFAPAPYFWTDQFDVKIQAYGIFPPDAEVRIAHGDPADGTFVAHYRENSVIVGVLGWNMPRRLRSDRALVLERAR
jgi:NADPH-dependent 2,4-dienoyl-CoA reductase/sulfur reductase-like enzyme